jgi:hypothetical protein
MCICRYLYDQKQYPSEAMQLGLFRIVRLWDGNPFQVASPSCLNGSALQQCPMPNIQLIYIHDTDVRLQAVSKQHFILQSHVSKKY